MTNELTDIHFMTYRYEAVGYDRWHRSYWCFDGITDRVWVRAADAGTIGAKRQLPANGGGAGASNFGLDGLVPEVFKKLGKEAEMAADWVVYYRKDGTLQALADLLASGPNGKRESALIAAMREHGVLRGLTGFEDESASKDPSASSPLNKHAKESTAKGDGDEEMKVCQCVELNPACENVHTGELLCVCMCVCVYLMCV